MVEHRPWLTFLTHAMLAMIPPVLIVIFMQKQFVKGMIETEN
jgi:sn-glycerol 3-phosphate transport system permease protein